jgi:hypothetical protein
MFTRIEPQHAGPTALGILVPQGAKTLVIVRPRALPWDLLPARWTGDSSQAPTFCVFTRDEAASVGRRLVKALEAATDNPVESFGDAQRQTCGIWLRTDEFVWIVCRRAQGEAYQPMTFRSPEEAATEAEKLAVYLWPAADATQEYYFNTQSFA